DYQVCDIDGDCSTATVTITVKETNYVPLAVDDNDTTVMETEVTIPVLNNDLGLSDGGILVAIYSDPVHGNVIVNGDNTITYAPNNWYIGSDSLEYMVSDIDGDYSIAKVYITINPRPNYIPVANDDARGTSINTDVIIDVLTNDTGLEDGGLVLTVTNSPTNGSAVVNGGNTVTYTPDTDYIGTDNFDYQVCDVDGDCSSATVTVTIREDNNIPVAFDDKVYTGVNTDVTIDVLGNDTGLDDGGIVISLESNVTHGTVMINVDNTVTYTPNTGFEGSGNFSYRVTDIDGDYDIADVEVVVMSGTLPGITVTSISGNTEENGTTATFTVVLQTQPTDDVNIDLNSDDLTEGVVSETRLTFTTSNWSTAQTVTITGQDDYIDDDDINYNIIMNNTVSSDQTYNGLTVDNLSLNNIDDDVAGISVIANENQTDENGTEIEVKLLLDSEPTEDVNIELSSDDNSEGMIDLIEVIFTSINWSDTVSVIVTGQDDNEVDGDITYNLVISSAVSLDSKYDAIDPDDITLVNTDNDSRELTIPEAFSPGNDGFNDFFEIVNLEHHDKATIKVYNRWGSLVYSNDNYQNDWDGKSNVGSSVGSELPTGTYYFVLEISDTREKKNGYVFIKR
ncbi:Ig-like domain-containing protein, partial [Bacteroidota bacterium]